MLHHQICTQHTNTNETYNEMLADSLSTTVQFWITKTAKITTISLYIQKCRKIENEKHKHTLTLTLTQHNICEQVIYLSAAYKYHIVRYEQKENTVIIIHLIYLWFSFSSVKNCFFFSWGSRHNCEVTHSSTVIYCDLASNWSKK